SVGLVLLSDVSSSTLCTGVSIGTGAADVCPNQLLASRIAPSAKTVTANNMVLRRIQGGRCCIVVLLRQFPAIMPESLPPIKAEKSRCAVVLSGASCRE